MNCRSHSNSPFLTAAGFFASLALCVASARADNPAARADGARVTFSNLDPLRTKGDPFAGGRWVSRGGAQASVESQFARAISLKEIVISTAQFGPLGSKGRIVVVVLKANGEPWKAKEFADVQICAPGQAPPASANSVLPHQVLPFKPPARALGLRIEFSGQGPFVLEGVKVVFEPNGAAAPEQKTAPEKPRQTDPLGAAAGRWALATPSGLRQDAVMILAAQKEWLVGFWDFSEVAGGLAHARWTGQGFEGQADLGEDAPLSLTFAVSADGQRLEGSAERPGGGRFGFWFVKQPEQEGEDLDLLIKAYAAQLDETRTSGEAPAEDAPDFSGVWVENAEADDTDLRFLRLTQRGRLVAGEWASPEGMGVFKGVVRNGALFATAIGPDGARKTYRVQLSESGNELNGFEGRCEGGIPGTPSEPWKRQRAAAQGTSDANLGNASDIQ